MCSATHSHNDPSLSSWDNSPRASLKQPWWYTQRSPRKLLRKHNHVWPLYIVLSTLSTVPQPYTVATRTDTTAWNSFKPVICYVIRIAYVPDVMYPVQMLPLHISHPRLSYRGEVITKKWSERQSYHQYATGYVSNIVAHLILIHQQFMDAFAKLRKVTVSFVMFVRLSIRPHGKISAPVHGFSMKFNV
jgi:hypothetical protein